MRFQSRVTMLALSLLGCSSDKSSLGALLNLQNMPFPDLPPLPLIFCSPPHIPFHPQTHDAGALRDLRHNLVPA